MSSLLSQTPTTSDLVTCEVLSFINPAITQPESVDITIPSDEFDKILPGLKLVAKIVQNLANNVLFGKERRMLPFNDFLTDHIGQVTRFVHRLLVRSISPTIPRIVSSETISVADMANRRRRP